MRELNVYLEINGSQTLVGTIRGNDSGDAVFLYHDEYLSAGNAAAISISLPLQKEPFNSDQTRNYFESLLPEGFSRTAVADWIKTDEKDYLTILSVLGRECLGAVKIIEGKYTGESEYELLTEARIKELAAEGATKSTQILMETHLSLTGATGKVGLYFDEASDRWYLPKGNAPSTHIVKQSHVRLKHIVLNEQLCMLTAGNLGIDVPESFIVNTGADDDELLYATKRYDRTFSDGKTINGLPCPLRLHQEDFAQALSILPNDKYEKKPSGYMKRMFDLIRNYSSDPVEDQRALLSSIIFNFLIGNTDCHVKNYSLLYSPDLRSRRLAPIYDLVATRVYKTTSLMSFFIGGELDIEKIDRRNFEKAADEIGMSGRMVLNTFDDVAERYENALTAAADELGNLGFEQAIALKNEIVQSGGYRNL